MADVELLPLPRWMETYRIPGDDFHTGPDQHLSDRMQAYARANVAHATAPLQAEIEALRAEVTALQRELGALHMHAKQRDQYAVEKAVQALDWKKRAERLAEALRRAHRWGGLGKCWDSGVALDLIAWIESGMHGELPPLPDYLAAALAQEDCNG